MTSPEELSRLHARCFDTPRPWTAAEISNLIAEPAVKIVSEDCGFAMVRVVVDEAELLTLAVAPDARRRGTGSRLLSAVMEAARAEGAKDMFLEVSAENGAALGLYRKFGFHEVGMRPGYYGGQDGTAVDALTLRKLL